MTTTIIISICYLAEASIRSMQKLAKEPKYNNLSFLFVVSSGTVEKELEEYISGFKNSYRIINANTRSSNELRSYSKQATTDFIYFHDCDDYADYALIDSLSAEAKDANEVLCYQVRSFVYDGEGKMLMHKDLLPFPNGKITSIDNIPTNIYSKLIPTHLLKDVWFDDLPYAQDWAISYSLYVIAPHRYYNIVTYFYKNDQNGCSGYKKDSLEKIEVVRFFSERFIQYFEQLGRPVDAEFLKFRYNTVFFVRLLRFGIIIKPYVPSFKIFKSFSLRLKCSVLYRYVYSWYKITKYRLKQ